LIIDPKKKQGRFIVLLAEQPGDFQANAAGSPGDQNGVPR